MIPTTSQEKTTQGTTRTRRSILVVDDDEFARRFFGRALHDGYEVDTAASGAEARELLDERVYDAVVCDVSMPDMNGIQFLKKAHESEPDLPVVLVTGAPHVESAIEAVDNGAFRYLVKPVEPRALLQAVDKAVRLRELARLREEAVTLFGEHQRERYQETERLRSFEEALDGIFMLYQPIVDIQVGQSIAHEALVRSRSRELTHPQALLEAAESLGQVQALGRRIRARIADDMMLLPEDCLIFVNLHPQELLDEELYVDSSPLGRFASCVVLEITERARLEEVADLAERVARLGQLGFRLAIDDLGSGYSGLSSVAALEPDFVKVDMTLVRDVGSKPKTRRMLQSILDLGKEIGLHVILEGVETHLEAETLVRMGARLLQGYFFGRPASLGHPWMHAPAPVRVDRGPAAETR